MQMAQVDFKLEFKKILSRTSYAKEIKIHGNLSAAAVD